ncbi:MAG: molybdate ABC transporter substrate-binding protein [Arcobacter sp.]|uniref:molybdate ABC transporter substrate-binding protein n=1 Tax=Arcobacter sp. TaxID=1872629 RepID=UPI003D09EA43
MFKKVLLIVITSILALNAADLKVAAGAGYKKPLMEIFKEYEKVGGKVDGVFGHLKQVTTQATQTNIPLIIGDKKFLETKSGLKFKDYVLLGEGELVVVYPKDKKLSSVEDLTSENIKKITIPDPSKAIYGIAGKEFLKNANLEEKLNNKLIIVATVPQAMTYILTNEVDAGFVNLSEAIANKENIGGFIKVDKKYYTPIEIVAGKLDSCNESCEEFANFLTTKTAKEIFKKYGL